MKKLKSLFLYLIVGAGATLVEWVLFYFLNSIFEIHYTLATTVAFIISTFANWILGRLLIFSKSKAGLFKELLEIYSASVIGLILNLIIMWGCISLLNFPSMVSKIIATALVFIWNFLIRKLFIYK